MQTSGVHRLKTELIRRIQGIEDTSLLMRIMQSVDELGATDQLDEYDELLSTLLSEDMSPLEAQLPWPDESPLSRFEHKMAWPMFLNSTIFITLIGIVITFFVNEDYVPPLSFVYLVLALTGGSWFLGIVEAVWAIMLARKESNIRAGYIRNRVWAGVIPPIRLGLHLGRAGELLWIPRFNLSKTNQAMLEELKARFSGPMIVIALLIVPILLIEMKFEAALSAHVDPELLAIILMSGQAFIWAAFAFEFTLMYSVAGDKMGYCTRNWMDLLIIALPLVSFLRTARLARLARIQQVGRAWRMKGVVTKARKALVLAEVVQKIMYPNPNKMVNGLRRKFQQNRSERRELERLALMAAERIREKNQTDREVEGN